jgi:hypothetical protein
MSRHWHKVSKPLQMLAAGIHPIMSEGMSPYELHYVLATDEEIQLLNELIARTGSIDSTVSEKACCVGLALQLRRTVSPLPRVIA